MVWIFNAPRDYPALYERFYDQFDFYNGRAVWLESIKDIPEPAVHLFCVHWLHLELHNGGFEQYFWNSTATSAPEAKSGFEAIGMPAVAAVVEEAMSRLDDPFPLEKPAREELLDAEGAQFEFEEIDRRFYDLADTNQVFRKVPRFVPYAEKYARDAVREGVLQWPEGFKCSAKS